MADTKISALPAVATPAATDEFAVAQAGASKKMTLAQIAVSLLEGWTDLGNLGASVTVTGADATFRRRKGTLSVASCAVTVTLAADQVLDLALAQDGTGGRAATFSGVDVWMTSTGSAPSLTSRAALAVDRFYFENVAGVVYGYWLTETASTRTTTALSPSGAVAERFPRQYLALSSQAALASGRLSLFAIELLAGQVVSTITFFAAGAAASAPTNQWFSLWDASRNLLGVTNDDTTTAWGIPTSKTLTLASSYTVPTSGLYYLGIVVVASTPPNLMGAAGSPALGGIAPILSGTSTTGLTTPASAPASADAITADSFNPYAYVS